MTPIFFISCFNSDIDKDLSPLSGYKYLAMGDSYTQGEGVCDSCSFPKQFEGKGISQKQILNFLIYFLTDS